MRWALLTLCCLIMACGQAPRHSSRRSSSANPGSSLTADYNGKCTPIPPADQGLSLVDSASASAPLLDDSLARIQADLPAGISVEAADVEYSLGATHVDVGYFLGSMPLCRKVSRIHQIGEQIIINHEGKPLAANVKIPDGDELAWDELADISRNIGKSLATSSDLQVTRAERCVDIENNRLVGKWDLFFQVGHAHYRALARADSPPENRIIRLACNRGCSDLFSKSEHNESN